jgi:hypothetical protein
VHEVGIRHGAASRKVAEEIIVWAQRKHWQIRKDQPYASLDRLPISTGPDPELWVQLDLRYPERLGWTISLTAEDGMVTLQFQYMKAPPFDTIEARKRMYDEVAALSGVNVEERLTGRPPFPMAALAAGDNLERFVRILDHTVDQMVESHKRSAGLPPSKMSG